MIETPKNTLLVVDDTPTNIHVLGGLLSGEYTLKVATNGPQALQLAKKLPLPDLILLDVMMPEMDGYEVCRQLKADPVTEHIPVIFVTAKGEGTDEAYGFALGASDYLTKPIVPPVVRARVRAHLALHHQRQSLEAQVRERTRELEEARLHLIACLGQAANYRDNETGQHVQRVGRFSQQLALRAGATEAWAEVLLYAAPLHDIGKIGIPDQILFKPGKLDEQEWVVMQTHSEIGAQIIGEAPSDVLQMAREVALTHHERWNGTGYPQRLAGEAIPLAGRIVALADVFDALTSVRPYKKAWSMAEALDLVRKEAGQHFDPTLAALFLDMEADLRATQEMLRD